VWRLSSFREGAKLSGRVVVSGAKNAALPAIAAALLTGGTVNLSGVPSLDDIVTMCELLESVGVTVTGAPGCLSLNARGASAREASYSLVRRMRASFLIAGPMLATIRDCAYAYARRMCYRFKAYRSSP